MEIILDDLLVVNVVTLILMLVVFLLTLSLFIYLSEDRKKLSNEIEKKQNDFSILFDKYFNCKIENGSLSTKVYFYENSLTCENEEYE